MDGGLHEIARHNAWATAQVLTYCRSLDAATLNATTAGTYGSIIELLRHIIDSEASYLFRINGQAPAYPWERGETDGLDLLTEHAATLEAAWEQALADGLDCDRLCEARGDDNEVFNVPVSVLVAQAFHHANEHRAQICTILGSLGLETPGVSAWDYALGTGRMKLKT